MQHCLFWVWGEGISAGSRSTVGALLACCLMIVLGLANGHYLLGIATTIPLYLLIAILVAWRLGWRAAVGVSIYATICLDFFCTEPRYTLRVTSLSDVSALFSFACVSLLVSHLSNKVHQVSARLKQQKETQRLLFEVSRDALLLDRKSPIGKQLCVLARRGLRLEAVALWDAREQEFSHSGDLPDVSESLRTAMQANSDSDRPGQDEAIRVLHFGARVIGAMLFRGPKLDELTISALANLMASTLERSRALTAEVLSESDRMSEELRSAVLDGLAHAAKTPLTTIAVASAGLREIGSLSEVQSELVALIESQGARLASLTDTVLRTSRLDISDVKPRCTSIAIQELFQFTAEELDPELSQGRLLLDITPQLPQVIADRGMLKMASLHIVENALRYSPPESPVAVTARVGAESVTISIHNFGTYIPPEERRLIFRRFYRSHSMEHRASGTGIGLASALRAAEAHGGRITVDSEQESGTTFSIILPVRQSLL